MTGRSLIDHQHRAGFVDVCVLEDGWEPALADGDAGDQGQDRRSRSGRTTRRRLAEIEGIFFLDDRTIYVRNEREEREEHPVPVVVPGLRRGRRSRHARASS